MRTRLQECEAQQQQPHARTRTRGVRARRRRRPTACNSMGLRGDRTGCSKRSLPARREDAGWSRGVGSFEGDGEAEQCARGTMMTVSCGAVRPVLVLGKDGDEGDGPPARHGAARGGGWPQLCRSHGDRGARLRSRSKERRARGKVGVLGFGGEEEGAGGCSYPPGKMTGRHGMAATASSVAIAPVDRCHDSPV